MLDKNKPHKFSITHKIFATLQRINFESLNLKS